MNILGLILGGGVGSRLYPLTAQRSKPAVPVAGKYRLVDIPISNCINSGIHQIYLLTQYNSASLHHHVQAAYRFDHFSQGFVQLLAAEQTPLSNDWFQGTADAVRQSLHHFEKVKPELVVVLSGDQLYRMNFKELVSHHVRCKADITVSAKAVSQSEAVAFGLLEVDGRGRITQFVEKPKPHELTPNLLAANGKDYLASMGIYVFNYEPLLELVGNDTGADFGKDILPQALNSHHLSCFTFHGYWKDIGTIRSFWEENLALARENAEFSFHNHYLPIYSRARFLPPSKIDQCSFTNCMLSEGVMIGNAEITGSVIGLRSIIGAGTRIVDSVIMGNDSFGEESLHCKEVPLGIGKKCFIKNAIIDKDVCIGNNVQITPDGKSDMDNQLFSVRDGVIVIPKGTIIPSDTVL